MTVVNRGSSNASGATKTKRAFVIPLANIPTANTVIRVNGSTLPDIPGSGTAADFATNLTSAGNLAQAENNGVKITANTHGDPRAEISAGVASSTVVTLTGVSTSTVVDNTTKYIELVITVDSETKYSSKVYLMSSLDNSFTNGVITSSDSSAERQIQITATTSVTDILQEIITGLNTNDSPFSAFISSSNVNSATIGISCQDRSDRYHGKKAVITHNLSTNELIASGLNTGFTTNNAGTTIDDTLLGEGVLMTFESNVAGAALSTVGTVNNTPGVVHLATSPAPQLT